ncbi:hypothetical protein HDU76_003396 [Blyttiomyces sp. JEL0837]|nr:hypothetical protein HDU76_003396 [Blyttiomyces sp. JEL0837]
MTATNRIRAIHTHLLPSQSGELDPPITINNTNSSHTLKSSTTVPPRANYTPLNPVSFLKRTSLLYPSRPAISYRDQTTTYAGFSDRVRKFASSLMRSGYQDRDVVAILAPNVPVILESYFAVPLAGCVLATINIRLNVEEVEYILQKSKTKILFIDREFAHLGQHAISKCGVKEVVIVDDSGLPSDPYEQFILRDGPVAKPWNYFPPLLNEDDVITINFTSGTTGKPKGVMYHYRGAYLNAIGEVIEMNMTCDSKYLWIVPMFHASGWCFPWAVTACAGTHVLLRKIDYDEIWRLFKTQGVTHYCAAPTVQTSIVSHPQAKHLGRVLKTMVAAAPPSPTLLERMMKLGLEPVHVYGLTETYGPSTVCAWQPEWKSLPAQEQAKYLSRQGQGFIMSDEVRVVDAQMNDTPWDGETLGEVCFSGNLVMKGYLYDEAATKEAFAGGMFHSGDLGVRHPDGYIELRDRKKDIIISGGENISTIEVEQAVVSHPSILEASVVPTPDSKWGERPVAYVTLTPSTISAQTPHEEIKSSLMVHLRSKLAGYKMPVRIEILDELPKTSTGKVQKFVLREVEWKKAGIVGGKRIN